MREEKNRIATAKDIAQAPERLVVLDRTSFSAQSAEKPENCPATRGQFVFEPATLPVIVVPQLLVMDQEDLKSDCNPQASSNSSSSM